MARVSNGFKGERIVIVPSYSVEEISGHELGRELYISRIGYFPNASFHYCEHVNQGEGDYVLLYCVDGKGWVTIGVNKFCLESDQLIVIPNNVNYAYGSELSSPWTIYWIHFNGIKASFFSKGFDKPFLLSRGADSRISERLTLFEEIYAALNLGFNQRNLLYASTGFFHFLGTLMFLNEYRACSRKSVRSMDVIQLAIHYMRENINRKITLSDIANYIGLSESYFSALFIKEIGISPLRYQSRLRFERACHYLDFTDMKVNQICPLVGYDDSLYFSRAFAKTKGMSPSEYRRINKVTEFQAKEQPN